MNGPALLTVQLVDHELDQLAAQAKRLPERATLAAADEAHRTWAAERARLVAVIDKAGEAISRTEHDAAQIDAKRNRLEAQLKTVIAPREAEALMSEIATLRSHRDALDDAELEAMEEQSEAEGAIEVLDGQEPALLGTVNEARAALDAELARIDGELESWRAKRAEAFESLSADDQHTYEEVRHRHGGIGFVRLEGRRCTGCHIDLSATEADTVKAAPADELPECPHCARLIVR